jgi:hypothetical protein
VVDLTLHIYGTPCVAIARVGAMLSNFIYMNLYTYMSSRVYNKNIIGQCPGVLQYEKGCDQTIVRR